MGSSSARDCPGREAVLTIKLIDFGRSLSAYGCASPAAAVTAGGMAAEASTESQQQLQLQALQAIQLDSSAATERRALKYVGEVSCKGYQCSEMQRGEPWSYQVTYCAICNRE